MSKEKIIIAVLIVAILAALIVGLVVLRGGNSEPKLALYETDGTPTVVRDFTIGREPIPDNVSYFIADTSEYSVFYNGKTEEFQIALFEQPVSEKRKKAEQVLLQELVVTQEQACKLKVYVSGPVSVDDRFDGQPNVGLSFCPGSVAL